MAQVGFPRLYSVYGVPDSRWDLQSCPPQHVTSMQAAKVANPNLVVLMLPDSNSTFPGSSVTYGGPWHTFAGATDTVVDGAAGNAGVIRAHQDFWDVWKKPDGTNALSGGGTSGHRVFNLANGSYSIGIEHTWQALARFILYRCKQSRLFRDNWDGYRSDNWMTNQMGGYGGNAFDANRDGVQDSTSVVRAEWYNALFSKGIGKYLRDNMPGKTVGGNVAYKYSPWHYDATGSGPWTTGSDPNAWREYTNFVEVEDGAMWLYSHNMANNLINIFTSTSTSVHPTTGSSRIGYVVDSDPYGGDRYGTFFFQLKDDSGNEIPLPANFNSPSVYKQETYYKPARKGWALATIAGCYYFPCFEQQFSAKLYYDDEALGGSGVNVRNWMGQPVAAYQTNGNGVFWREFQNGLAIVNVTSTGQSVTLPGGANNWRKIAGTAGHNDGATITTTTFTIPAHDGRFLVRLGTAPSLPPVNTVLPTITGTVQVGQALVGTVGTWLNSPTSYAWTWARYSADGSTRVATLATGTTSTVTNYTLVSADSTFTIRLEVTATNADGSGSALSAATGVVGAAASTTRLDTSPSLVFDFTIGSVSTASSVFPASLIFDFEIEGPKVAEVTSLTMTGATSTSLGLTPV